MVYQETKRERALHLPGQTPVVRRGETQSQDNAVPSDPSITEHVVTFTQELVAGELTQQLLR